MIAGWPREARLAARSMMEKYGAPDEVTPSLLIWRDNGQWRRTIVHRDGAAHDFPRSHKAVLEQSAAYSVPEAKADDVLSFNRAVMIDGVRGEIVSRADREEMNFLVLNLAADVAEGRKRPEEARRQLTQTSRQAMAGRESEYTRGLRFASELGAPPVWDTPTGDPSPRQQRQEP